MRAADMSDQNPDSKGPSEFARFTFNSLSAPDELSLILIPISIVIGVVFGLIWLLGWVFRSFFNQ
jgi:hypothetical protein